MECAWLAGPEYTLQDGAGCVCFEASAENDVTVIFKPTPGARRWQPMKRQDGMAGAGASMVEDNYTVILGSHRNSCLKFEKNGHTCCMVDNVVASRVSSKEFQRYWIDYNNGTITVGSGAPGSDISHVWVDPGTVIPSIKHVGLSGWDKHVRYRNIYVAPPVDICKLTKPVADDAVCIPSLHSEAMTVVQATIDASSVCTVAEVAYLLLPNTRTLYHACLDYIAYNFKEVVSADGEHKHTFSLLSAVILADLLVRDKVGATEQAILDAVLLWTQYGQADQSVGYRPYSEVEQVLSLIRFPIMQPPELQAVFEHPASRHYPGLQSLVDEAVSLQTAAEQQGSVANSFYSVENRRIVKTGDARTSARFQRRKMPFCKELMYVFDGDQNGVIWFIATQHGSQPWVNPVLARRVEVKASSPASRYTDPKAVVGGKFPRTNYAGPRYEDGQPVTWWMIDLGEAHQLSCNYYVIRHDDSMDFIRHWALQGSVDLRTWVDLRRHTNDSSIRKPGQYAAFPVSGPAASFPYRAFRVILTGPTASPTVPWNFCLSYFELYGYLYKQGMQHS